MIISAHYHINELIPETGSCHIFLMDAVSLGNNLLVVSVSVCSPVSLGFIWSTSQSERSKEKRGGRLALLGNFKMYLFLAEGTILALFEPCKHTYMHTCTHTHGSVHFWKHTLIFLSFRTALLGYRPLSQSFFSLWDWFNPMSHNNIFI